jgi:CHAT domain-containing protein
VYPLLNNQIHLLDDNFAILLGNWATLIFREVESEQSYDIADTIAIFSELIREFPRGDRAINLEIAITGNKVASIVLTRQAFPSDWAMLQNNLGIAYCQRIRGDRADNLERAIQYDLAALEVRTRQAFSYDWAATQNNLGNAYRNRIQGEKAENLEAAISCFKHTLEIFRHETYPEEWAQTQYNLGNAYFERIRGERAENLEEVIRRCKAALKVCTRHALPEKWALIQNNLGSASYRRLQGDKADNLETAIAYFQAALEVRTRQALPENWAMSQNNLGEAYSNRIKGTKTENMEKAIQCFKEVLEVRTRQAFPEKWAITQHNLAGAYFDRERIKGTNGNFEAAIRCLKAALEIRTPEASPRNCVNTMGNLGFVYQHAQQFNNAYNSFAHAIDIVESLRSEIVSGSGIAEDKQKLAEEWNKLYQGMVEVCLVLDNPAKAIEYVERSKARHLAELIASRDLYPSGTLPENVRNERQRLRQNIDVETRRLVTDAKPNYAHINQLRQQYNELNPLPQISFKQIKALINENTTILEWHIAHNTFQTFIMTCHRKKPTFWQSSSENLKALVKRVTAYMLLYYRNGNQNWWRTQLESRFQNLAEILHLDDILSQIPKECNQLILIPHRFLHFVPLHALPLADGKCLLDKFDSVRYAPSCQLLQQVQQQQRPNLSDFFAIQNPEDNLSYADLEVEVIRSFFSIVQVLNKQTATKATLTDNQDLSSVHCSHFSCHGTFNLEFPLESALLLANEERLTLAEIFGLSLNQCRLVTLSACETGLTDPTSISDEYIGLPSGFLYAGCTNVVSSLWTVNQVSTAFLMIKFYQNMIKNQSNVAKALNDAQRWLRDATQQQLLDWANQLNLDEDKMTQIEDQLDWYNPDDKPYNDPFHWAAFCAIGQ